jgi:hypothetical protein
MSKIMFGVALAIITTAGALNSAHAANERRIVPSTYAVQEVQCVYTNSAGEIVVRPDGGHCRPFDDFFAVFKLDSSDDPATKRVIRGVYTGTILSEDRSKVLRARSKPARVKLRADQSHYAGVYFKTTKPFVADGSVRTFYVRIRTFSNEGGVGEVDLKLRVQTAAKVPPPPAWPACKLSVSPSRIEAGASVTLWWTTENGTSFSIDQGIGTVTPASAGSVQVTPVGTTTYTGTVIGPHGTAMCSATVALLPELEEF